ncbi:hypothetical protein [Nostoc sp.]|uniref:hypothetical protein n=1 Tax=Nostoc sp. TaxID=1180 RepID=UPI002FF62639
MDIALLVKFLAPCLPFLLNVGKKVVEGASQKVGEDVWNKAKAIWTKLYPKVEFPSEFLNSYLEDIKKNKSASGKKAWKLLNDNRFKK